MDSNPYDPPQAKTDGSNRGTWKPVVIGCGIAALACISLVIALFVVCTAFVISA
jgi:hypothetical protein